MAPLRALAARIAQAELTPRAGNGVDDLQSLIRVIGVAEYALAAAVGSNVPRVVLHNGTDFARGPVHAAQSARPDRTHQVPSVTEKGFVDHELIIAVLVEAFETPAVAPDAVHSRSRIA